MFLALGVISGLDGSGGVADFTDFAAAPDVLFDGGAVEGFPDSAIHVVVVEGIYVASSGDGLEAVLGVPCVGAGAVGEHVAVLVVGGGGCCSSGNVDVGYLVEVPADLNVTSSCGGGELVAVVVAGELDRVSNFNHP